MSSDELPKQPPQPNSDDPPGRNDSNADPDSQTAPKQNQQQQNQFQQQQQQYASVPHSTMRAGSESKSEGFFSGYQRPSLQIYDEIIGESSELRSHWQRLARELTSVGNKGIEHHQNQIQRMIHQNGIAYSAYGDPSVRENHLQLDPIPHLLTDDEWQTVEKALSQRADLLNLMLADLYGSQSLVTNRVLPPDVLFNHPHYELSYHNLPIPGGKHLHFYAAELIRSPKGDWWINADRTDSPGGSGFALENRITISRAFPNIFKRSNVHRLAPYFIALRDNLIRQAKTNKDDPRIAILSAGAGSTRYFEDSFLARYLGFTLVQNRDLVVRSGRVMLKTLAGLLPVDVIFRRHQSNSLDPLELGGGVPGIPGILQVIRDQKVVVVNAPGSGLVESPIFMAFMPQVCQALLGTDLIFPGIATWWGGQAESLELMLDRIDEIRLLPAFRQRSLIGEKGKNSQSNLQSPKFMRPEELSREERINLLKCDPTSWVGQEKVARSSSAVWKDGRLRPGYVSMRTFLTVSEESWASTSGGLVRVSEMPFETPVDPFEGGTKDAWVTANNPVVPTSLLRRPEEVLPLKRRQGFVPSKIAENLYWLGRYLERADASARLVRAVAKRLSSETDGASAADWPVLVRTLATSGQIDARYAIPEFAQKLPPVESTLALTALSHGNSDSLRYQVDQVVVLAGMVRDRLSSDAWRIIQELSSNFNSSHPQHCDLADLLEIIDTLIVGLGAFSGFVSDCMTRTHAYNFLSIGRRLEHGLQIVSLIRGCFVERGSESGDLMEAVLEISESRLTYRSRYYALVQLQPVLDLLLADKLNPRSLRYQVHQLAANLKQLPGNEKNMPPVEFELASTASATIKQADLQNLCETDEERSRNLLEDLLNAVEQSLSKVSTIVSNRFFAHSGELHQLIAEPSMDSSRQR